MEAPPLQPTHAASTASAAGGAIEPLLRVVAQPSHPKALKGVLNKVQVEFKIITGQLAVATERAPINLAIVLDRSGSMDSKGKLECAKEAIVKVIEALGDKDVLHFVVYGSKINTIFADQRCESDNKATLIAAVKKVRTEGCTNLWGGLEEGARLVSQHSKPGYTQRIFLFSDGYPILFYGCM